MSSQPDSPARVLVIEDDADARANLHDLLELEGYIPDLASNAREALAPRDWSAYAAILLDRRLPDAGFEELLPLLRRQAPEASLIVITGSADLPGAIAALREGAADYIIKPLDPNLLRASLRRAVERQNLRRAKERSDIAFRALVEAAEVLIVIARFDRTILYFSPFAERFCGLAASQVLGRDLCQTIMPADQTERIMEANQILQAGQTVRGFEGPTVTRGGEISWVAWNVNLLPEYEGAPAVLAVGHDITNLKRAQERALQSERLAAIGQMVAGLAHESRNALQRGQACLELISLKLDDRAASLDLIRRIQAAHDHLHYLYEDVRGYAATIKLERALVPLVSVWRDAWHQLEPIRARRDAALVEKIGCLDLECSVDPFRLAQVFRNIFDNAMAACRDPVRITVSCAAVRLEFRNAVRVAVQDNGPGLNPEQARQIFEPFYTTKTRGTGLGMPICRRIVEAHGGKIAVGDSSSAGAEIVVTIPIDER